MLYLEKHVGTGEGTGERIINPETEVYGDPGSFMEIETTQIRGVDSTNRVSKAVMKENARIEIREKILTHGKQYARTEFSVDLDGEGSSARLISRSVATEQSSQLFVSNMSHEASIGRIAGDQLMKLMSLGLTEKEAEEWIIRGFLK